MNWVREWDRPTFVDLAGESQAAGWRNFFATNTGMFLRNAVIYQLGMIQHYQSQGLIPQSPLGSGSVEIGDGLVRLTPDTNSNNIIGNAAGSLLQPVEIFGWLSVSTPSEQLPYWLLVRGNNDRLVWITAAAIGHNESAVTSNPQTNWQPLAPDRNYTNSDLQTILGG